MPTQIKMQVTAASGLAVRASGSLNGKLIRYIPKNTYVIVSQVQNGWAKHDKGGWSSLQYLKKIQDLSTPDVKKPPQNVTTTKPPTQSQVKQAQTKKGYDSVFVGVPYDSKELDVKKSNNIFGMPPQYLPIADRRYGSSDYGRRFLQTTYSDAPLVVLKPGLPQFLSNVDKKEREATAKALADNNINILNQIFTGKDVRYYTFKEEYNEFIKYVNSLCQTSSIFLKIGDLTTLGKPYKTYDWDNKAVNASLSSILKNALGGQNGVTFFMDANSAFDENMTNTTSQSVLDSGLKSASDMVREAEFLMGAGAGAKIDSASLQRYNENIEKLTGGNKDPNSIVSRLGTSINTIRSNGNILFPEIWRESGFSKSYNIPIKLSSPYGDPESIYLYILVPFFHLIAMVLPRVAPTTVNGYVSPFLIRAYSKGVFNIEMGIVESLTFKKGGSSGKEWNIDGLPTEIEVNITIKDLYPAMSMAMNQGNAAALFFANTAMMDYMSNICGVNINESVIKRTAELLFWSKMANIQNIPMNIYRSIDDGIFKKVRNVLGLGRY